MTIEVNDTIERAQMALARARAGGTLCDKRGGLLHAQWMALHAATQINVLLGGSAERMDEPRPDLVFRARYGPGELAGKVRIPDGVALDRISDLQVQCGRVRDVMFMSVNGMTDSERAEWELRVAGEYGVLEDMLGDLGLLDDVSGLCMFTSTRREENT